MLTFSQAHSHASTNATRRHEYFRGLSRLLPVPGVLVSFLELRFLGKMALLALRGRPQPLKKPSQSQKGHFYEKMNALSLLCFKNARILRGISVLCSVVRFIELRLREKYGLSYNTAVVACFAFLPSFPSSSNWLAKALKFPSSSNWHGRPTL